MNLQSLYYRRGLDISVVPDEQEQQRRLQNLEMDEVHECGFKGCEAVKGGTHSG